jgi:hypothetical protein
VPTAPYHEEADQAAAIAAREGQLMLNPCSAVRVLDGLPGGFELATALGCPAHRQFLPRELPRGGGFAQHRKGPQDLGDLWAVLG